jgi:polar amino acid transport system permease protein
MWSWDYVVTILPDLLYAFRITISATFVGFALAAIIGLVLAITRRTKWKPLKVLVTGFIEFIRSTPLLIQIFFLYYSVPMLMPISMSAFTTGVIGLGIHYGAYLSEVYRSGIEGVPRGQWEAASALNLSRTKTWLSVILPQAIPPVIPVMGNYLIVIFKETPILSAITLVELLLTAKNTASVSYRVFEPYTVVGIIFLVVSYTMSLIVMRIEKRLAHRVRG